MTKKILTLGAVFAILAAVPAFAAQSRLTEFHKSGVKLSGDGTLNIKFPNGLLVTGTVLSSTGAPLKNATVFAGDAAEQFAGFMGVTDAAGKFAVPVQAGTKIVMITPPTSASVDPARFSRLVPKRIENVVVAKDKGLGAVKLKNGFILSGSIAPPAGTPALKTLSPALYIYPAQGLMIVNSAQTGGSHQGINDRYAVALPAGSYRIWAAAGAQTQSQQVVPMQPALLPVKVSRDTVKNIVLPKGAHSLSGAVTDAANTKLNGFLLVVAQGGAFDGGVFAYAFVSNGVFGIDPNLNQKILFLPAGRYKLVFLPLDYTSDKYKGRATVTYYDLTMPSAAKTLALVAANGFVLSGKATDTAGKAVVALITASDKGAQPGLDLLTGNMMMAISDEKGSYRISLPADTLNIQAYPLLDTPLSAQFEALRQPAGTASEGR
jgi:hypothetical protein